MKLADLIFCCSKLTIGLFATAEIKLMSYLLVKKSLSYPSSSVAMLFTLVPNVQGVSLNVDLYMSLSPCIEILKVRSVP